MVSCLSKSLDLPKRATLVLEQETSTAQTQPREKKSQKSENLSSLLKIRALLNWAKL